MKALKDIFLLLGHLPQFYFAGAISSILFNLDTMTENKQTQVKQICWCCLFYSKFKLFSN